jgi:nucleotide-binding universal stress UspA family protein
MTFRRILVPTDFSEPSEAALELALELARRFDAELDLFHAQDLPAYIFPDAVVPVSPTVVSELERASHAELDRLAARVRAAGVRVSTSSSVGSHDGEILRHAENTGCDLIVMGTHGRTGIKHALLGSVAERVVRRAPCPVMTVRPQAMHAHAAPPAP